MIGGRNGEKELGVKGTYNLSGAGHLVLRRGGRLAQKNPQASSFLDLRHSMEQRQPRGSKGLSIPPSPFLEADTRVPQPGCLFHLDSWGTWVPSL